MFGLYAAGVVIVVSRNCLKGIGAKLLLNGSHPAQFIKQVFRQYLIIRVPGAGCSMIAARAEHSPIKMILQSGNIGAGFNIVPEALYQHAPLIVILSSGKKSIG